MSIKSAKRFLKIIFEFSCLWLWGPKHHWPVRAYFTHLPFKSQIAHWRSQAYIGTYCNTATYGCKIHCTEYCSNLAANWCYLGVYLLVKISYPSQYSHLKKLSSLYPQSSLPITIKTIFLISKELQKLVVPLWFEGNFVGRLEIKGGYLVYMKIKF